jgi:hypothetical protein
MLAQFGTSPSPQTAWVVVAAAAFALVYLMVVRPKMRKRDPLQRMSNSTLSQERNVERQMQSLLVELSEMSRQISGQLDTRAAKLEAMIHEADEKIAQLRVATGAAADARSQPPLGLVPSRPAPAPELDARHAEIYALADAGRDAHQIARELSRPRGEVELILALRAK